MYDRSVAHGKPALAARRAANILVQSLQYIMSDQEVELRLLSLWASMPENESQRGAEGAAVGWDKSLAFTLAILSSALLSSNGGPTPSSSRIMCSSNLEPLRLMRLGLLRPASRPPSDPLRSTDPVPLWRGVAYCNIATHWSQCARSRAA